MKKFLLLFLLQAPAVLDFAQSPVSRPKLVVGIIVDQMRWDYLYRYYDRYAPNGGFRRLINNGFSCEQTMIPYTPTITACGHTSIYTGSVPAIHGITGNDWFDYNANDYQYCTTDTAYKTIGSTSAQGKMSPRQLLVTTISDELRLATNFRSKVIGIALKDRGAILPAGHSANAAFWYDNSVGDWISSSYYLQDLPKWQKDFNARKLVDKYYSQDWTTLYPLNTYAQSAINPRGFNHPLKQYTGKNYSVIAATPFGNTLTVEMAKAAIAGEQLGAGSETDLLAISFSSPDYIGHAYGPNSVEAEDGFLRLDKDLGDLLNFLDEKIGKGQYLLFLSADHGAANSPAFLKEHHIPSGNFDNEKVSNSINELLKTKTNTPDLVLGIINYQLYLDRKLIKSAGLNSDSIQSWVIGALIQDSAVERAIPLEHLASVTLNSTIKNAFLNGYYPTRSGDIQILFKPQWLDGFLRGGSTHGVWNPYDAHIPLLWYGWNIAPGKTFRPVQMTDIAPTLAALLHIQMPSGSIGQVIEEISK
jgi:predicted AlkP superfamily pyrophosphatase or phosphodiesterase